MMDEQPMDLEDDYWNEVDEIDLEGFIKGLPEKKDQRCQRRIIMKNVMRQPKPLFMPHDFQVVQFN